MDRYYTPKEVKPTKSIHFVQVYWQSENGSPMVTTKSICSKEKALSEDEAVAILESRVKKYKRFGSIEGGSVRTIFDGEKWH
jgi:hypothetical protein